MFCQKCGAQIPADAHFCTNCGIMVEMALEPSPVVEQPAPTIEKVSLSNNENEFIENTRRLLRWEQKAWRISGNVFTILGAVCMGLMGFVGFIALFSEPEVAVMMFTYVFAYAFILFTGILQLISAKKIEFYLETIDSDFHYTADRCGSIGMMIFTMLFNTIALVFFLINFTRIRSCQPTIERIIAKQK